MFDASIRIMHVVNKEYIYPRKSVLEPIAFHYSNNIALRTVLSHTGKWTKRSEFSRNTHKVGNVVNFVLLRSEG